MTVAARTSFSKDTHGVAILEFALILPILLLLSFGGYATTEYILASRKAALACRTVADLASKYASIGGSDMADILNASVLVIAPLPSAPLTVRLSEVSAEFHRNAFHSGVEQGTKYRSLRGWVHIRCTCRSSFTQRDIHCQRNHIRLHP